MSGIEYTPKEPRTRAASRFTEASRRRMSEASQYPRSSKTKEKMAEARRKRFVNKNHLELGEVYLSYVHTNGHRRHVKAVLSKGMELSLNGENWVKLMVTEKAIKEASE